MMKEAESHADEDRKRKEEVEVRNRADQAVYAAERMLKDTGDKLAPADRQPVEAAMEELKKAIEKSDVAGMNAAMDALNQAQHKAAEALYRQTAASGGGPGAAGGGPPPGGPAAGRRPAGRRRDRRRGGGGREEVVAMDFYLILGLERRATART